MDPGITVLCGMMTGGKNEMLVDKPAPAVLCQNKSNNDYPGIKV